MPDNNNTSLHLTNGFYGAAIRGGTTFAYANLGDTIRTVAQTQNISSGQVWAQAVKEQGYIKGTLSLHLRGMAPNLLRVGSREALRAITMSYLEASNVKNEYLKAGLMTSIDMLASIPDTIKVLQQSNPEYRNRWVYPMRSLLAGVVPTAVRQGWRWGAVYVAKPQVVKALDATQDKHQLSPMQVKLLANFTVASLASFMVLPFDAVKSRLQNGQSSGNYLQTFINLYKKEGARAMLRGGLPKWFITVNAVMNTLLIQDIIKANADAAEKKRSNFSLGSMIFSKASSDDKLSVDEKSEEMQDAINGTKKP